jgi:outer membrane protein
MGTAFSSTAFGEDLLQVYRLAEQKDPQFLGVQSSYKATLEHVPQARARLLFPNLSISANTTENWQDIKYNSGFSFLPGGNYSYNSRGYSLNLTQPVFHWDRYMQLKQAGSEVRQAQLEVDSARQDLIVTVAQRYFDVLAAIDNVEFSRAEKEALARQLDQTQQRFKVGLIAITDVQEAKAGYDLSVADEIAAKKALDDAHEALREVSGDISKNLDQLSDTLPLITPEPADAEKWTQTALKQNLKLASAEAAAEIANREIAVQRAGHYPTVDIVGSHGTNITGGQFGHTDTDASAIGVELNVPIYSGGLVVSRTREARFRHEASLDKVEAQRRAATRQARDAYAGVISGISRVEALKQALKSTQTALEATEAGYAVGTRTAVDVVTQERELYGAKRDYAKSRYEYILDTLRLKQAAGTLSPANLEQINKWLVH